VLVRQPRRLLTLALALALVAGAIGGSAGAGGKQRSRASAQLTILAAASLTNVFPQIDGSPRYSFAGSDQLAAQIQQGVPADVFAAASPKYPDQLYAQGLVEKPLVFARNRLVLVVPNSNPANIHSVYDLRRPGIKLVIGNSTVPVGSYTRTVLKNMGLSSVLSNVVSQEVDVRSVLTKVVLGEADAGFVYVTDALTVPGQVKTIAIPAWAQPKQAYEIAVVKSTGDRADAVAFIKKVMSKSGQALLKKAGFLPPPPGTTYKG
jgi:molybdate transport system substrate-binding protein